MPIDVFRQEYHRALQGLRLPELGPSPGFEELHREARNLNTPPERLLELATTPDRSVRFVVLQHPDTPDSVFLDAVADPDAYGPRTDVLRLVAIHPHGSPDGRRMLEREQHAAAERERQERLRKRLRKGLIAWAPVPPLIGLVMGVGGTGSGHPALVQGGTALLAIGPLLWWLARRVPRDRGSPAGLAKDVLLLGAAAYLAAAAVLPQLIAPVYRLLVPVFKLLEGIG